MSEVTHLFASIEAATKAYNDILKESIETYNELTRQNKILIEALETAANYLSANRVSRTETEVQLTQKLREALKSYETKEYL